MRTLLFSEFCSSTSFQLYSILFWNVVLEFPSARVMQWVTASYTSTGFHQCCAEDGSAGSVKPSVKSGSQSIGKYTHEVHCYHLFWELGHFWVVQQVEHPSLLAVHLGSGPEMSNPAPGLFLQPLSELLISSAAHPKFLVTVLCHCYRYSKNGGSSGVHTLGF